MYRDPRRGGRGKKKFGKKKFTWEKDYQCGGPIRVVGKKTFNPLPPLFREMVKRKRKVSGVSATKPHNCFWGIKTGGTRIRLRGNKTVLIDKQERQSHKTHLGGKWTDRVVKGGGQRGGI